MSRHGTLALGLILSFVLVWAGAARRAPGLAQEPPAVPEQTQRPAEASTVRELVGMISCSASACHGGNDLGQPRSEATTWRAFDPHARAYDTLLTSQSKTIAKVLWGEKATAHEAALCLKCHVQPDYDAKQASPNYRKEDGVGCESCHGAAKDWLTPHYRENWRQANKRAKGFADTKSLPGRAGVCAGCHVGMPAPHVNHDLIAAGHPALRFEFATYLANLPPHWNVLKDQETNSTDAKKNVDFEARAWAVGQLVVAASALELLAHRADPKAKLWPEFAEMDCFACHHELTGKSWRQLDKHLGQRRPGSVPRNTWYQAMLPDVLAFSQASNVTAQAQSFAAQRNLFTNGSRLDLAKQANDLAKALREAAQTPSPAPSVKWLHQLGMKRPFDRSWEEATQRYLALLALRQLHKDNKEPEPAELERLIAALRKDVAFRDFNRPREFVPAALRDLENR